MAQPTFRILGRLEILIDGRPVDLPSRREGALLGVLLLQNGKVVSVDALIDSVWGDPAPASARHMVHEYVSRLRAELGEAEVIATRAPGYTVAANSLALDAEEFDGLVAAARRRKAAGELDEALQAYDSALELWRGDVLAGVELEGEARAAADRLESERRAAGSERVDVALGLGRHAELVPSLERAVADEPLDEHLLSQLMLALYRSGRQADALSAYRNGRQRLVDELGIEPGAELRALEQAILRHDPELAPPVPAAGIDPPPPVRPRRRIAVGAVALVVGAGAVAALAVLETRHSGDPTPAHGDALAVVDASDARLVGTTALESRPGAIASAAGSIWVSYPDERSIARISPSSWHTTASVSLGVPAQSLAAVGGTVWAAGSNLTDTSLTLDRIDATFDTAKRVRRLPLVAQGDTGSLAGGRGTVVVAPRSGFLTSVDARTGRVLSRVDPTVPPTDVARGFGSTWLAYREANEVVRIDATGDITAIPVGREPSAITVGRHDVWVADSLDDSVESIDPATGAAVMSVKVGAAPDAIAEGDGSIWVANGGDGTLTRIDERTNRPTAHVTVGGSPQALVVADGKVWVSVQPPPPAQPSGGTLVVSVPAGITWFDPAMADAIDDSQVEYAICSTLLNNPDEAGPGGLAVVPDAASAMPTVSDGGRVYRFLIRRGMRFSPPSNELVTAETFKSSIERTLSPAKSMGNIAGPGEQELNDVVGEAAYLAGKARHISGITAHGYRLTIRLTHPTPDFPELISHSAFCALPTDMPLKPQLGAFPTSGPYYIAAATPGRSLTLLRNPNYHGDRPRRPRRIDVVIGPQHPIESVEDGKLDYAIDAVSPAEDRVLARRYGAGSPAARSGRQQYFVTPKFELDDVDLNNSRPLFASARMRRAVNYALDRRALAARGGAFYASASVTQMYLPPGVPGFRDEHIYPLTPDVAEARRLAGPGHRTAVIWCPILGGAPRAARIIAHDLAAIGIDAQVKCFPGNIYWDYLLANGAAWDLAVDGQAQATDQRDYFQFFTGFGVNSLLASADRKSGLARAFAYERLDDLLVRKVAPQVAYANESAHDFFSARIGCQLVQAGAGVVDLGALCIRR